MAKLRTELLGSLRGLPRAELEEVTADGHTFASAAWYQLLEQSDLRTIIGGQTDLAFLVTWADDAVVAACPVLRVKGAGAYFLYSLRRYYFEHWIEEATRLAPDQRAKFARLFTMVSLYRSLLEKSGSALDDCLVVTCPLAYRGRIPVAPSSPVGRAAIYRQMIRTLQRHARALRLPIWFLAVEADDNRLTDTLEQEGCTRSFLFHDNQIALEGFRSLDDYLGSFRRTTRRAMARDLRRCAEAGITFSFEHNLAARSEEFATLYRATYSKYGESFFRHPPRFWADLGQCLGDEAEAIIAQRQGELLGFSILLKNERRGEMWTYRIGRTPPVDQDEAPYYFGLSFYGPIGRAIELGYRRLWLGPAAYEAKSVRGAFQVPLESFFWFPRRWDRWFLAPYLRLFGEVTRAEIAKSIRRPIRLAGEPRSRTATASLVTP